MKLNVLVNGAYHENCYIISHEDRAVLIDPGVDYQLIADYLSAKGLTVDKVLITHAHFDHCQCVHEFDAEIYISKDDYALAQNTEKIPPFKAHFYEDEQIEFAGHAFKVISTPGHTQGSVCIEYGGILFTGDTLFNGALGRTDLPTGSLEKLKESLKMLCQIYNDIQVLPGHGAATLLSEERPFIERF